MTNTILTLTVSEKGNRLLAVASGAPEGEMPVVRSGLFAARHQLLDEVWVELKKRKPQTVKAAAAKTQTKNKKKAQSKPSSPRGDAEGEEANESGAEDEQDEASESVDQAEEEAGANAGAESKEPEPVDLPAIEGDTDG